MVMLIMDGFFYVLVWSIGIIFFLLMVVLYLTNRIDNKIWHLFWIGFVIGICWELPMSIANEYGICCDYPFPPSTFSSPTPIQGPLVVIVIVITHSFWDGALFLVGSFFVYILCRKPIYQEFTKCELGVLILFGQSQELLVELVSTSASGWFYNTYWFNPPLFPWMGRYITLLPQLIWLSASILFYFIIIKYEVFNKKNE
jgi:hypothetical protein